MKKSIKSRYLLTIGTYALYPVATYITKKQFNDLLKQYRKEISKNHEVEKSPEDEEGRFNEYYVEDIHEEVIPGDKFTTYKYRIDDSTSTITLVEYRCNDGYAFS